jgi:hypothetical protein
VCNEGEKATNGRERGRQSVSGGLDHHASCIMARVGRRNAARENATAGPLHTCHSSQRATRKPNDPIRCMNGYHPQPESSMDRRFHRPLPPRVRTSSGERLYDSRNPSTVPKDSESEGAISSTRIAVRSGYTEKSNLSSYEACVFLPLESPYSTDAMGAEC